MAFTNDTKPKAHHVHVVTNVCGRKDMPDMRSSTAQFGVYTE